MYNVQLDISLENTFEEVQVFARDLGCTTKLLDEIGPAGGNSLYQFSSDEYSNVKELIEQIMGTSFDEDVIKVMIWES